MYRCMLTNHMYAFTFSPEPSRGSLLLRRHFIWQSTIYFQTRMPGLLELTPEIRILIYDFCFPSPCTRFQLVPYHPSIEECKLSLPLSAYSVCKTIYHELPLLRDKLRSLDLLYIIHGTCLEHWSQHESQSLSSADPTIERLRMYRFLGFAERVRLYWIPIQHDSRWNEDWCTVTFRTRGWMRHLPVRSRSPMRVLEVDVSDIERWNIKTLRNHVWPFLRACIIRPTVPRLEIRWMFQNGSGSERLKDYAASLNISQIGSKSDMAIIAEIIGQELSPFDMYKAGQGRFGSVLVPESERTG